VAPVTLFLTTTTTLKVPLEGPLISRNSPSAVPVKLMPVIASTAFARSLATVVKFAAAVA
jgi:hypothetical protein